MESLMTGADADFRRDRGGFQRYGTYGNCGVGAGAGGFFTADGIAGGTIEKSEE